MSEIIRSIEEKQLRKDVPLPRRPGVWPPYSIWHDYGISSTTVSGGLSRREGSLKIRFIYFRTEA